MPWAGIRRGRRARVALWAAAGLIVLLVVSQLLLPRIAERVARERIERYGRVLSVRVSAFPAIELLWGHAQSASARVLDLSLSNAQAIDLLWGGRGVTNMDVSATSLRVGALQLHHVGLRKRGARIYWQGLLSEADLRAALPSGVEVHSVTDASGRVELGLSGGLFGVNIPVRTLLLPSAGRLVAEPLGLAGLTGVRVTLFSDPRLRVQAIDLGPLEGSPLSRRLSLRATLAGS